MGVFTQNIQQLERSLTSEQKKQSYKKQKIRELELTLYNKFYTKFYKNKEQNPDFVLGYFQNPDKKKQLLNYDGFLDDIEKTKIYNNILNNVYKDFKKYYILEIDTSKIKPEEEKPKKENTFLIGFTKTINFIIYIFIGFIVSICFGKTPNNKKYKI